MGNSFTMSAAAAGSGVGKDVVYYSAQVRQALGGDWDGRTNIYELLNDAGRTMFAMEEWKFNNRPPYDLDFTANDSFVALPSDFGKINGIQVPSSLDTTVKLVTMSDILQYRSNTLNDPFHYYVALVYPTQTAQTGSLSVPRLEVYPTPSAASTGALKLDYEAGWVTMSAVTHVPNIPINMETLYLQIIIAMARSLHNPRISQTKLLDEITAGSTYKNLSRSYGNHQQSLGSHTGGIVGTPEHTIYRPFEPGAISTP
jgi:hypothetical protein